MSRLSNLLRQVETQNPQLAADLKREMEALAGRRAGQPSPRTSEGPRRFQTNRTQPPTVCGMSAVVMELAGAGMVSQMFCSNHGFDT